MLLRNFIQPYGWVFFSPSRNILNHSNGVQRLIRVFYQIFQLFISLMMFLIVDSIGCNGGFSWRFCLNYSIWDDFASNLCLQMVRRKVTFVLKRVQTIVWWNTFFANIITIVKLILIVIWFSHFTFFSVWNSVLLIISKLWILHLLYVLGINVDLFIILIWNGWKLVNMVNSNRKTGLCFGDFRFF